MWGEYAGTTLLLALVRPCKTNGLDATESVTLYRDVLADVVVDLQSVQAVVGRVKSRDQWGIVDRSRGLARTVFDAEEASAPVVAEAQDAGYDGDHDDED